MTSNLLNLLSTATSKYIYNHATAMMMSPCCHRFPVQSMVFEPGEGRVLSGVNANELLDVKGDELSINRFLYVSVNCHVL